MPGKKRGRNNNNSNNNSNSNNESRRIRAQARRKLKLVKQQNVSPVKKQVKLSKNEENILPNGIKELIKEMVQKEFNKKYKNMLAKQASHISIKNNNPFAGIVNQLSATTITAKKKHRRPSQGGRGRQPKQ